MNSNDLNASEAFAQALVAMGAFMGAGHTYEETYVHAAEQTTDPRVREVWQAMVKASQEGRPSPLQVVSQRKDLIAPWLVQVFLAGVLAGAESIWSEGGKAFLDIVRNLRQEPHPTPAVREKWIATLAQAGTEVGLSQSFSASAARQFIER